MFSKTCYSEHGPQTTALAHLGTFQRAEIPDPPHTEGRFLIIPGWSTHTVGSEKHRSNRHLCMNTPLRCAEQKSIHWEVGRMAVTPACCANGNQDKRTQQRIEARCPESVSSGLEFHPCRPGTSGPHYKLPGPSPHCSPHPVMETMTPSPHGGVRNLDLNRALEAISPVSGTWEMFCQH